MEEHGMSDTRPYHGYIWRTRSCYVGRESGPCARWHVIGIESRVDWLGRIRRHALIFSSVVKDIYLIKYLLEERNKHVSFLSALASQYG